MIERTRGAALLALFAFCAVPALAQQPAAPPRQAPAPPAPAPAPAPAEQVQIAPGADADAGQAGTIELTELIARIAEAEDRQFLVDPRVSGRVLAVPPIENPTFDVLLSILRIHSFAAVMIDGRVHIVPDAYARQLPTRVVERDSDDIHDDELVSRVITLDTENASMLVPLLRPLMPQYAHLATSGNKLLVVDRYDNVRRIEALARTLSD